MFMHLNVFRCVEKHANRDSYLFHNNNTVETLSSAFGWSTTPVDTIIVLTVASKTHAHLILTPKRSIDKNRTLYECRVSITYSQIPYTCSGYKIVGRIQ